jgi:hypothetical protein
MSVTAMMIKSGTKIGAIRFHNRIDAPPAAIHRSWDYLPPTLRTT